MNKKIKTELSNFVDFIKDKDFLLPNHFTSIFVRADYPSGKFDERSDIKISKKTIDYVIKNAPLCISSVKHSCSYILYQEISGYSNNILIKRITSLVNKSIKL